MRVISQGKDISMDFDRTTFWIQGTCIFASVIDGSQMIAAYKSVDRVNEVFMEIHNAYCPEPFVLPEFEPGISLDDTFALFKNQISVTPAVLTVPHDEGCECVYNPCMIYYMPEE